MQPWIEVEEHAEGIVISVKAQPGASKNALRSVQNRQLRVAVTQVAEKGKANKVLVETIAKELGLKKSAVELVSGPLQPQKKFLLRGVSEQVLIEKLSQLFPTDLSNNT